ncbi:putative flagellar protein [Planoprotostelium fungivorum]|uniref:Putative flagellar protein n=1 Tax=Planoprotostelium fungivorum TaxID=1890364 RepID=A0A2P6NHE9_9EUKA|nr:putative flagellar protein [Planoprotostelium fungivorum]
MKGLRLRKEHNPVTELNEDEYEATAYSLEKIHLDEDEEQMLEYEEVDVGSDSDEEEEESFEKTLNILRKSAQTSPNGRSAVRVQPDSESEEPEESKEEPERKTQIPQPYVERLPEVVDDFFRNFLIRTGLHRTLEVFQTEWYEAVQKGDLREEDIGTVPNIYLLNKDLSNRQNQSVKEIDKWKNNTGKLQETINKLKKERDFHRMHHKRVGQEKNKLLTEAKDLKQKLSHYRSLYEEEKRRADTTRKEKVLLQIEKDNLTRKLSDFNGESTNESVRTYPQKDSVPSRNTTFNGSTLNSTKKSNLNTTKVTTGSMSGNTQNLIGIPSESRPNPWTDLEVPPMKMMKHAVAKVIKAHDSPISALVVHPTRPLVVTGSDDRTWKMWALGSDQSIMQAEGHRSWISDADFHPQGSHLVTSSGDCTLKIWDLKQGVCSMTLTDHNQAVWSCAFHDLGDYVISASMDKTCKLFDIHAQKCRQTLRGHVDSVNCVTFQPFSNNVATGSGDKTVSLWDIRTGICHQTFYGRNSSVNYVSFNHRGDNIVTTDADGVVKVFDVRTVTERISIQAGPSPANKAVFDRSGTHVIIPSDDHNIKIFNLVDGTRYELKGHDGAVQAIGWDVQGDVMISVGADGCLRSWSA